MVLSSDNFPWLLGTAIFVFLAAALLWVLRPNVRRHVAVRLVLLCSGIVIVTLVTFLIVFVAAVADMPDMREF